jgi:hypothetical protein
MPQVLAEALFIGAAVVMPASAVLALLALAITSAMRPSADKTQ